MLISVANSHSIIHSIMNFVMDSIVYFIMDSIVIYSFIHSTIHFLIYSILYFFVLLAITSTTHYLYLINNYLVFTLMSSKHPLLFILQPTNYSFHFISTSIKINSDFIIISTLNYLTINPIVYPTFIFTYHSTI